MIERIPQVPGAPAPAAKGDREQGLADEQLRAMLRTMLTARQIDHRCFQLNRQGKIPFALGSEGHEAAQAGAGMAFERGRDVLVPYYRDLGLALAIGFTPYEAFLSLFARAADRSGGRQFPTHHTDRARGLLTISSIIAAQCPHAVGVAYAMKYRKESGRAVLCSFGDGTTSEGEWHESLNFAAVQRVPIIFFCQNNEWAISVPLHRQMAVRNVAERAAGYGMPGETVDGMDPVATYGAVRRALERARDGGGPTLVEAKCYRYRAHSTDDDDRTYRRREEIEHRRGDDPVLRFERRLLADGVMTQDQLGALRTSVKIEVDEALDAAEAAPSPEPRDLYTNVYAGPFEAWQS